MANLWVFQEGVRLRTVAGAVFLTGHSRFHPDQSWVSLRLRRRKGTNVKTGDDGSAPVLDESRSFMSDCRLNKYWKPLAGTED